MALALVVEVSATRLAGIPISTKERRTDSARLRLSLVRCITREMEFRKAMRWPVSGFCTVRSLTKDPPSLTSLFYAVMEKAARKAMERRTTGS